MTSRRGVAVTAALAVLAAIAVSSALAAPAATPAITPTGAGSVRLGDAYTPLRRARAIGTLRPGCELAGPGARSARLRAPLRGSVDFTETTPRRVATITVSGGATARGVGIGARPAAIRLAFPRAVFDHGTDAMFGITLVTVPRGAGGRLQFAVATATGRVTLIGVPRIPFCE